MVARGSPDRLGFVHRKDVHQTERKSRLPLFRSHVIRPLWNETGHGDYPHSEPALLFLFIRRRSVPETDSDTRDGVDMDRLVPFVFTGLIPVLDREDVRSSGLGLFPCV